MSIDIFCATDEAYCIGEEKYKNVEWGDSIREHEKITFEYRTTSRGTVDEYKCSCCGCYIYFPAFNIYASEKIDYAYCPYCGKPVAEE